MDSAEGNGAGSECGRQMAICEGIQWGGDGVVEGVGIAALSESERVGGGVMGKGLRGGIECAVDVAYGIPP